MPIDHQVQFQGVYYLESRNPHMNPIAIRPEITPPDYVAWEDTGHGRVVRFSSITADGQAVEIAEKLKKIPDRIEFTAKDGQVFVLVKLTVKVFNAKLKEYVAGGGRMNFDDDKALQEYYLKADFYSAG